MHPRLIASFATLTFAAVASSASTPPPPAIKKVLYFTKSSNFEHSVVKRFAGNPSWSEQSLAKEGPKHGIEFTFSKDGSLFSPEYLAQFDAFMFYTSGDLTAPGKDGNPPMSPAGKAALLDAIAAGKGFIGIHSATDTFHTGETAETDTNRARTWRYANNAEKADPYVRMLGAEFIVHGVQQPARVRVPNPAFPGFSGQGDSFLMTEELYSLIDFSHDLHVLLAIETDAMRDPEAKPSDPIAPQYLPYVRPSFPVAWARLHGKGRVFYTALGHREDMWLNPIFLSQLFGGISWAVRNVEADIPANIKEVTPEAWTIPPSSPPVSGTPKPKPAPAATTK
jgi:type 1 glutamine amidotransferase